MEQLLPSDTTLVFRPKLHVSEIVALVVMFLGSSLFFALRGHSQWLMLPVVGGTSFGMFWSLHRRLEIGTEAFRHKTLTEDRCVDFGEVGRAYFKGRLPGYLVPGGDAFWIEIKQAEPMKLRLRDFPIEAWAVLFAALDRHGIPIEVGDRWGAQRIARQIRECQAKLAGKQA